jgi:hypothetical protein
MIAKAFGTGGNRTRMLFRAANFKSAVSASSTTVPGFAFPSHAPVAASTTLRYARGDKKARSMSWLLLIVFDRVGRAHVRDFGVLSRIAASAALT